MIIAVSHDRWFLDRTIDNILRFEGDGNIRSYPGDYSAYLDQRAREEDAKADTRPIARKAEAQPPSEKAGSGQAKKPAKKSGNLSFKEKRALADAETRIENAEARKAEIEALLTDNPSDFEAVVALSNELGELTDALDHDVDLWSELAERA